MLAKPAGLDQQTWDRILAATPEQARQIIREGSYPFPTSGLCPGYAQANLISLPKEYAYDFLLFAQRNPKPCPILEVMDAGEQLTSICANGANVATDFPAYRIYQNGELTDQVPDVLDYWREDLVSFLIGCSFSFESEIVDAGIEIRHNTLGCNVPMYRTNIACTPAGRMHGNMVVSMRPLSPADAIRATQISGAIPQVHGAPVHLGDPAQIGIADVAKPDFGDPVTINPGEVPVFWACGVTPQSIVMESRPPFAITHAPGCMLITDTRNANLKG